MGEEDLVVVGDLNKVPEKNLFRVSKSLFRVFVKSYDDEMTSRTFAEASRQIQVGACSLFFISALPYVGFNRSMTLLPLKCFSH